MKRNDGLIYADGVLLKDEFSAQIVAEEIFKEDCYRLNEIPKGCLIIDIGAFYGEFGLWCAISNDCQVLAYEPLATNYNVLLENVKLNSSDGKLAKYSAFNLAVTGTGKKVGLTLLPNHPAGTITNESDAKGQIQSKRLSDIVRDKAGPICVKMDCEGAEVGIFRDDHSWMDQVDIVMMEWHDHDGHLFQNELTKRGFKVELERCGPRPQDPVDLSVTRGLLFAKR